MLLVGFDKIGLNDTKHFNRMVHFFLYDYKFERVWKNPDTDLEKLKHYRAVLSPDFSIYVEMAPVLQLTNTFRNRWCGAYFASKGIRVIPTVSWGNENTFEFCFDGIEKGSTVAVSTYMVSEHDNHQDQKEFFLKGYNEMLRRIEPEKIICYNEPFPEMQGNIVFVDYDRSSWKYMDKNLYTPSKYAKYICGEEPLPVGSNLIIKSGSVVNENHQNYNSLIQAGMGSAYGAMWKPNPNKPNDRILWGPPNTIQKYYMENRQGTNGYWVSVKYDSRGWAIKNRHYTDHNQPWAHTNPHDKIINWDPNNGTPDLSGHDINYPLEEYPNGAPEFKFYKYKGEIPMILTVNEDAYQFKTLSEFKSCMSRGGDVEFKWKGIDYTLSSVWPNDKMKFSIGPCTRVEKDCTVYDTVDELLEYKVGGDRLRDIITQAEIIDRTL
ncbi:conserved protein of unknown function [Ruminococcaceae bacterium BL-4]|nr:conserved protein of unknown function [Ruminococcaceae bacterium BL-4]